jgi:hypothetical protein
MAIMQDVHPCFGVFERQLGPVLGLNDDPTRLHESERNWQSLAALPLTCTSFGSAKELHSSWKP